MISLIGGTNAFFSHHVRFPGLSRKPSCEDVAKLWPAQGRCNLSTKKKSLLLRDLIGFTELCGCFNLSLVLIEERGLRLRTGLDLAEVSTVPVEDEDVADEGDGGHPGIPGKAEGDLECIPLRRPGEIDDQARQQETRRSRAGADADIKRRPEGEDETEQPDQPQTRCVEEEGPHARRDASAALEAEEEGEDVSKHRHDAVEQGVEDAEGIEEPQTDQENEQPALEEIEREDEIAESPSKHTDRVRRAGVSRTIVPDIDAARELADDQRHGNRPDEIGGQCDEDCSRPVEAGEEVEHRHPSFVRVC